MPAVETLAVFAVACVVFAVVPGPAVFYVITRGMSQGRSAGVASALGIETGNLVHVGGATVGLSAVVASSPVAFNLIKYLGAAYLVYIGIRTLLTRSAVRVLAPARQQTVPRLFSQGVIVAVLNPKTALFFLSFLPQFVSPSNGPIAPQMAVLGCILVAITALSDCSYAIVSGSVGKWLQSSPRVIRVQRMVSGGVYIGLGMMAAFSGSRPVNS